MQTNHLLEITWKMWIQATNSGKGGFLLSVPVHDPANPNIDYNPPLMFMDSGAIVAATNSAPGVLTNGTIIITAPVIGSWASLAGTVMTNELILDYPDDTFSYSLDGQMLATLPLGPYFSNVVDTITFTGFEREPSSLGNRFAIGDVQVATVPNQAQFTFGPQVQSTNSASISFDSATGLFQYTDSANSSEDFAYLPLIGVAADSIAATNNWTASLSVSISPRTIALTNSSSAHVLMGLVLGTAIPTNVVFLFAGQWNNTGGGDDAIYPNGWYGTAARFGAILNRAEEVTTPLGDSVSSSNGSVYLPLTGATNATAAEESFSNVTGTVTLAYNASTKSVTGYYNGVPFGSYSLAGWGYNPPLTLAVWGGSGKSVDVPVDTDTAAGFFAGQRPILTISRSRADVVLSWPTNASGFKLQSTLNLSPAAWTTVLPLSEVFNGQNVVSNSVAAPQMFYRLSQ